MFFFAYVRSRVGHRRSKPPILPPNLVIIGRKKTFRLNIFKKLVQFVSNCLIWSQLVIFCLIWFYFV